jgi:hypothetical protein
LAINSDHGTRVLRVDVHVFVNNRPSVVDAESREEEPNYSADDWLAIVDDPSDSFLRLFIFGSKNGSFNPCVGITD